MLWASPLLALLVACANDNRAAHESAGARERVATTREADTASFASAATNAGNNARTGWYPDQPGLDPSIVSSSTFGKRFDTLLSTQGLDQVFAQPLVVNGHVFVATESNNLYSLDAATGAILRSAHVSKNGVAQAPWNVTAICGDLKPTIGVSGTPVVDAATNTAYFFAKTYEPDGSAAWYAHAVDVDSLVEHAEKGFPVKIAGTAANHPEVTFDAFAQMQRPGLLLLNGVVYAGFGSHCDYADGQHTWHGWIAGVGTDGVLKTLFVTNGAGHFGAGLWHAGGGLVSDGAGRIFFETGNGYPAWDTATPPTPGNTPPNHLGEAMVRAEVQADGSLRAADFFTPASAHDLDNSDQDLGSGGPIALPDDVFGIAPKLAVGVGKEGVVYLFDRDNLGGYKQGPGGTDGVVNRINADAGAWSRPAVWPGDGGYVYLTPNSKPLNVFRFGLDAGNKPALFRAGQSAESFGYTSGSPVVTSNGKQSGTALVWVASTTGPYGQGQLRAYDAVPDAAGALRLRFADAIGTEAKFSVPGIGGGRVFMGTADGHVIGYGALASPIAGNGAFGAVQPHTSQTQTVTLIANQPLTITALGTSGNAFVLGSVTLPVTLAAGGSLNVPVTFTPPGIGAFSEALNVTTSIGAGVASLKGAGQSAGGVLAAAPLAMAFGGVLVNSSTTLKGSITNAGSQALAFSAPTLPAAPFVVSGLPAVGTSLAPNASVPFSVTFSPGQKGNFASVLTIATTAGNAGIPLSGYAGDPGHLTISSLSLGFGDVPLTTRRSMTFAVGNSGGLDVVITKSKPPAAAPFSAVSTIPEGQVVHPGQSLVQTVTFAPVVSGLASAGWIITGDDGAGVQTVDLFGNGSTSAPGVDFSGGFPDNANLDRNGVAAISGNQLQLTTTNGQTASAFAHATVPITRFHTQFAFLQTNAGADGFTFTIQNNNPQAIGGGGGALGYTGIANSVAVKFDLYDNAGEGPNSTGVYSGGADPMQPSVPFDNGVDLHAGHAMRATLDYDGSTLTVAVTDTVTNATSTHAYAVNIPQLVGAGDAYVGFTAATGGYGANQVIQSWSFTPQALPYANYGSGFTDVSALQLNGTSAVVGGALQLTTTVGQTASVFTKAQVPVTRFQTQFGLSLTNANADGLTFTIQGNAPTSMGGGGGALGYYGIGKSVAVKFDLYNNQGEGTNSTGIYTNGALATTPAFALDNGVNLHSGHALNVAMTYDGVTLGVTIQDAVTLASTTRNYAVNIPAIVGSDTAYVGFTGATGGLGATQAVTRWTMGAN